MGTSEPGGTGERLTEQTSSPDGRTVLFASTTVASAMLA